MSSEIFLISDLTQIIQECKRRSVSPVDAARERRQATSELIVKLTSPLLPAPAALTDTLRSRTRPRRLSHYSRTSQQARETGLLVRES